MGIEELRKLSHPATDGVQSTFAPFFEYLAGRGYSPKWYWQGDADKYDRFPEGPEFMMLGRIDCAGGPIRSVELMRMTEVTEKVSPHEMPDYAVEWKTTNHVSYNVDPDWGQRWVPGLHMLSIRSSMGSWTGNDMGLGIVNRLNGDGSTRSLRDDLTIKAVAHKTTLWPSTEEDGDLGVVQADPHAVLDQSLAIYSSTSTRTYKRSGSGKPDVAPPLRWQAPQEVSWEPLVALWEQLIVEPEYMPRRSPPKNLRPVPAPRINYVKWAPVQALTLSVLAAGLVLLALSISWIPWQLPGNPNGWWIFGGVGVTLVGGVTTLMALSWFDEIQEGCIELVGVLDRKWVAHEHARVPRLGDHYVRVEGLPFVVSPSRFRLFAEGDKVIMLFWPRSKELVRLYKWTT